MAYSIRTHFNLKTLGLNTESTFIKQIYARNKNWNPEPAPNNIEEKITQFEKLLKTKQNQFVTKHANTNLRNLTMQQSLTLRQLKQHNSFTIKPTDKNLGPAILDTQTYIRQILQEHLLTKDYQRLSPESAKQLLRNLSTTLKSLITSNATKLTKAELTYFQRSLTNHHRIPIFYGLPKVHKTPFSLRPVVSTSGSLLAIFSTWLDFKMKDLLPYVLSYTKNSESIIKDLQHLHLPEEALLFTADAKSMYTNIDSNTGITSIRDFITTNISQLPQDFPTDLFLQTLKIVMENNVFEFAGSYWLQLIGTAMGTPAACAYATISYGQHENSVILPNYAQQLLYYKRYIDDIFGIWLPPKHNHLTKWNEFKQHLNSWGSLEWTIEGPSRRTNFLDLDISIKGNVITTSTFQKAMNLYMYIPPLSAHPPSCFKGLIAGELRRYYLQNNTEDFKEILTKFIGRLLDRGHNIEDISPLLLQAANNLDRQPINRATDTGQSTLYIHWTHHPKGPQRRDIRHIYNDTLKDILPFDRMQIALSRPKNLRDILTRAAVKLPPDQNIDTIIQQCLSHN
jgi:hypothetical protein